MALLLGTCFTMPPTQVQENLSPNGITNQLLIMRFLLVKGP